MVAPVEKVTVPETPVIAALESVTVKVGAPSREGRSVTVTPEMPATFPLLTLAAPPEVTVSS
jgi:hypothetical protein